MTSRRRAIISAQSHGILPPGYQPVKYLESSHTQFINTMIKPFDGIGVDTEFAIRPFTSYIQSYVFGAFDPNMTSGFGCHLNRPGYGFSGACNNTRGGPLIPLPGIGERIRLLMGHNGITFGGVIYQQPEETYISTANIGLFCGIRGYGPEDWGFDGIITTFNLYDAAGKLIYEYIPVLDNNMVPCVYDGASNTTFYNVGTGTFGYETLDGTYVPPT